MARHLLLSLAAAWKLGILSAGSAERLSEQLASLTPASAAALLTELGETPPFTGLSSPPHAGAFCTSELTPYDVASAGLSVGNFLEVPLLDSTAPALIAEAGELDCTCAPASCDCDKACFCGVRATSFAGRRRAAPPGLAGLGSLPPDHDCACSVGEVGGLSVADMGNSIDCDCLDAPCECRRSCSCSPKGTGASPQPSSTAPR